MSAGANRRRTRRLSREVWICWAFVLPFVAAVAHLWLVRGGEPCTVYRQGFWSVADGMLTGLAAVFYLRETLPHRLVLALFYCGVLVLPLMVVIWAVLAWLSPESVWPTPNLYG